MLNFILAQAANDNAGSAIGGLLLILGIGWFVAYLCRPRNKGWNIEHQGRTTVKPRK